MTEHDRDAMLDGWPWARVSRRGFLTAASLGGAATLLAACGSGSASSKPSSAAASEPVASAAPEASAGAAASPAEAALHTDVESDFNLYNWVDYDAPETTAGFQDEYGTTVILDIFNSNEEALAKFQAGGGAGYDMMAPTGYAVPAFSSGGFLTEARQESPRQLRQHRPEVPRAALRPELGVLHPRRTGARPGSCIAHRT